MGKVEETTFEVLNNRVYALQRTVRKTIADLKVLEKHEETIRKAMIGLKEVVKKKSQAKDGPQ